MPLADSDVQKIAWLARLSIEARDIPAYRAELSGILSLVEQMNAIDTRAVPPLAHPLELPVRLRADKVTEHCPRDEFQQQAPLTGNGYYLAPKVIE